MDTNMRQLEDEELERIERIKSTCKGLHDEKVRIKRKLKELDEEMEARRAALEARLKREAKEAKKRKRQQAGASLALAGGDAEQREAKKEKVDVWTRRCAKTPVEEWSDFSEGYAVVTKAIGFGRPLKKSPAQQKSGNGNGKVGLEATLAGL